MTVNVLVAYASKYGSTAEIARAIGEELRSTEHNVEVSDVANIDDIACFDAVVIGSAIYVGQFQKAALEFVDRFEAELAERAVWIFSSGPIGEELFPRDDPPGSQALIERTRARSYRNFPGRLDRGNLGFGDRIIATVVRAPDGDFRDWDAVTSWAREIANELSRNEQETQPTR